MAFRSAAALAASWGLWHPAAPAWPKALPSPLPPPVARRGPRPDSPASARSTPAPLSPAEDRAHDHLAAVGPVVPGVAELPQALPDLALKIQNGGVKKETRVHSGNRSRQGPPPRPPELFPSQHMARYRWYSCKSTAPCTRTSRRQRSSARSELKVVDILRGKSFGFLGFDFRRKLRRGRSRQLILLTDSGCVWALREPFKNQIRLKILGG